MVTRADISVLFFLSPRLVVIDAPSAEIAIQDLHDTLKDIEDEPSSIQYAKLIDTTGKDDLGGGVFTGLNSKLQNAQVMFQRRTTVLQSGTITTASVPGVFVAVEDSAAFFIANGVKRGDIVVNRTDFSHSEVLSVESEVKLFVMSPTGGTEDDFDIGESYDVFQMTQCEVSGGNLVAVDTDGITPINSIFPTFGTQVVRTSSSSATLQEQADIQFASYNNGVTIDAVNGVSGTAFPIGTPRVPVNNLPDAAIILADKGFKVVYLRGSFTISAGTTNVLFQGQAVQLTTLTINAPADVTGSRFRNLTVTGTGFASLRTLWTRWEISVSIWPDSPLDFELTQCLVDYENLSCLLRDIPN